MQEQFREFAERSESDAMELRKEIADLKRGGVVVLDACCGSRMMWFDRKDPRAVFVDRRQESHILPDKSSKGGYRTLEVRPDVVADFTALPFEDGCFAHLAFDPPHFTRNGAKGWVGLKYGTLSDGWQDMLTKGFEECFRVLAPGGTLVFKWCESDIPLRDVLALTPHAPLYGNKYPKRAGTHWIVWVKDLDHLAASRSRTIPADRVLREGEARIGMNELQMLRCFAGRRMSEREYDRLEAVRDAHEEALRAQPTQEPAT